MKFTHYPNIFFLLAEISEVEDELCQCISCRVTKVVDGYDRTINASLLLRVIDAMNEWRPNIHALEHYECFISHGSCKFCVRNRLMNLARKRQQEQGFEPCFGTAMDGHCSEKNRCCYYNSCVVTRAELLQWQSRQVA